jgi:hypothetical protein
MLLLRLGRDGKKERKENLALRLANLPASLWLWLYCNTIFWCVHGFLSTDPNPPFSYAFSRIQRAGQFIVVVVFVQYHFNRFWTSFVMRFFIGAGIGVERNQKYNFQLIVCLVLCTVYRDRPSLSMDSIRGELPGRDSYRNMVKQKTLQDIS